LKKLNNKRNVKISKRNEAIDSTEFKEFKERFIKVMKKIIENNERKDRYKCKLSNLMMINLNTSRKAGSLTLTSIERLINNFTLKNRRR
jgi:ribulose 1,5-bisphosphate carboxylase large subunit-like protein